MLRILLAVAIAVPLISVPFTVDRFVLPKLVALQLGLAILLAIYARGLWNGSVSIQRTPADIALAASLLVFCCSAALSVAPTSSIFGGFMRLEGLTTALTYAVLFWISAQIVTTERRVTLVAVAVVAGGYLSAVIAVESLLRRGDCCPAGSAFVADGLVRATAMAGNPNVLGGLLAICLPLVAALLVGASSRSSAAVLCLAFATLSAGLVLTLSLSSILAGFLGAVCFGLLRMRTGRERLARAFGAVAGSAALALVLIGVQGKPPVAEVISARAWQVAAGSSTEARAKIWSDTLRLVASRPLFGYGAETFSYVYPFVQSGDWGGGDTIDRAHDAFLDLAASQGAVGVAGFVWLLATFRGVWRRSGTSTIGVGVTSALVAYFVWVLLNYAVIGITFAAWLLLGAAAGVWTGGSRVRLGKGAARAAAAGAIALAATFAIVATSAFAADALYQKGLSLATIDTDQALAMLRTASVIAPQRIEYKVSEGDVLYRAARFDAARVIYESVLGRGYSDADLLRRLALADAFLGRAADASTVGERAVHQAPFDPSNATFLADLTRAIAR